VETLTDLAEARKRLDTARRLGLTVGLVPTMGALHEGHLSLVRRARAECGWVVVTLFVNPTQFGPGEDFERYPRDLDADAALCAAAGADLLLSPPVEAVYRPGAATWVTVEGLTERFEGAARPGHFRGVATIVAKLFNLTHPDRAYFGRKDYQQLQVIRRLATDLDFPLTVVPCDTVRSPGGLALSSRNAYLTPPERSAALGLSRGLRAAEAAFAAGERSAAALEALCRAEMESAALLRPDYVAVADCDTLTPVDRIAGSAVLLVAGWVGRTRLIDNIELVAPD
jgi:pantoate--beta-alanine ligase